MRVEGLCSSSEMPSYWPWRQVLTNLLGETDLLDQSRFASQPELSAAIVETIEARTRAHRVLVIFEDAHWADPGSLALLEFLIGVASGQRLMLLVTALDQAVPLAMSAGVRRLRCCLSAQGHECTTSIRRELSRVTMAAVQAHEPRVTNNLASHQALGAALEQSHQLGPARSDRLH